MMRPPSPLPFVRTGPVAAYWYVRFFRDPVGTLIGAYRKFGPVFALGGVVPKGRRQKLHAVALGPDFNRQIFGDPALFRSTGQSMAGPVDSALRRIRHGLTRMNGEKHKQQRRLISPVLAKPAVGGYCDEMIAISASELEQWPVGRVADVWKLVRRLALRVSSQILFGREDPQTAIALGELLQGWLHRNFSPQVWAFPIDLPGTPYRGLLRHSERIERTLQAMIDRRRSCPSPGQDMLEMLVRARDDESMGMTDAELIGQANILFGASFETVATSMTWTLFLLAQHPRIMADVHDELRRELHGEAPRWDQLHRLPLLDAVIKESMRILPPVPFAIRSPRFPTNLGDLSIDRGDRVICSHYITHHLPELYDQPERFDPMRWFTIDPGPYEYLPFSAGPRLCSGYLFAMTEIKVALAMILQRWKLTALEGTRIDRAVRITLGPKHGMPMTIEKQDGRFQATTVRGDIHEMVELSPTPATRATPAAA